MKIVEKPMVAMLTSNMQVGDTVYRGVALERFGTVVSIEPVEDGRRYRVQYDTGEVETRRGYASDWVHRGG